MSYTNTFFSFWWTLWNNNCDIYGPAYERDNKKLAADGWKPMIDLPCQVQTAEFWWDALNDKKISPPGMTTYSRDEANAIFQAGDAAFTVADTTFLGTFNNPDKSSVAGKVGIAPFPVGPMSKGVRTWIDIWGLVDSQDHSRRPQGRGQETSGRDAERRRRPDRAMESDRRSAAEHRCVADAREERRRLAQAPRHSIQCGSCP